MEQKVLDEAWELFGKAVDFDDRSRRQSAEGKRVLAERTGLKAQEYLERAAALEATAVARQAVAA